MTSGHGQSRASTVSAPRFTDIPSPLCRLSQLQMPVFDSFTLILLVRYHPLGDRPTCSPALTGSAAGPKPSPTFVNGWVARFGVPETITTDRGRQFESHLWRLLTQLLGCKHLRTTAYHPIANGIIQRFHRQLKSSLRVQNHASHWTEILPLALLSIRTSLKGDLQASVAELLNGTTLRLPGEVFEKTLSDGITDPTSFVARLRDAMCKLKPPTPRPHPQRKIHIHRDLSSCTHVFVRIDRVCKPLQYPYSGPYKVLERAEKYFTLDCGGRRDTVLLDRLKPAYLEAAPEDTDLSQPTSSTPSPAPARITRSGRRVHFPKQLIMNFDR